MSALWPVLAALGVALFLSGLPALGRSSLRHRVDPYVQGIRGTRHPRADRLPSDQDVIGRLAAAGLGTSLGAFRSEQLVWGGSCAAITVGLATLVQTVKGGIDLRVLPVLAALLFGAGYLGRDWWLSRQVERRRTRLRDELPAAIDLLTLSMMAGESVAAACARVAAAIPTGIGVEFARVTADVRAGTPIVEALEGFARRVPEVGVGRFVDALCVGIEKGAPLADTLRAQADDVREARRRRLLELGGRREVLMLVPVVFLIMPVVVVFALYPGLVTLELLVP